MKRLSTKFKQAKQEANRLGYKNIRELDKTNLKSHKLIVKKAFDK